VSTFKRALPVTLTSFINKSGSIGLSIVPILLVERRISPDASAWVVGAIRVAGLAGVMVGGWCCDRLGLRATVLLSFVVSGLGLLALPVLDQAIWLAALACLAQLGTSLYYASARMLITQIVLPHERREAIAWQRTANNFAQVFSFSLGAALSRFGTTVLILFDAFTSFVATGVGAKLLPRPPAPSHDAFAPPPASTPKARLDFYQCALIIASFSFLYDFFEVGAAARCKVLFGAEGLAVYSELMIINTVLCAGLSVLAAKRFESPAKALPLGMLLLVGGLLLTFSGQSGRMAFFAGSFVMTLGEITFNSLAALVLIELTPTGRRPGATYSTGLFVQWLGRIAGGALAFPLLVGSSHPFAYAALASAPAVAVCWLSRPLLRRMG
jgi:MFS family permease